MSRQGVTSPLPIATDILSRYCLGGDQDFGALQEDLAKADAYAKRLIGENLRFDSAGESSFMDQIEGFARTCYPEELGGVGRGLRWADGVTSAEFYRGQAGFLLGFAVALRLRAAVQGPR